MSIWYEAKDEDIEVENGEVIVSFTDLAGESCYVTFDLVCFSPYWNEVVWTRPDLHWHLRFWRLAC